MFPHCAIKCHKPICKLNCSMPNPSCVNHCVESECELKCNTNHCDQPLCRLACDHKPEVECCSCHNYKDWELKDCCPCHVDYQFKLHDCTYGNKDQLHYKGGLENVVEGDNDLKGVECKLVDSEKVK